MIETSLKQPMKSLGIRNRSRPRLWRRRVVALVACALIGLTVVTVIRTHAAEPATAAFQRTWERTDEPVDSGLVSRTWMWGDGAFTGALEEPYMEGSNGVRTVQYFDKSRMEDNSSRATAPWDVTNGLLVIEMVTGNLQVGDGSFEQRAPAGGNVAGDQDDSTGVTYQTLAGLLNAPARPNGSVITVRIDQSGRVTDDPSTAGYGVTSAYRVTMPGIDHQVASPFWAFMNSSGTVYENGNHLTAPLFVNPFYATGLPITEAYWAKVKVAATYQDVLLQCFERRRLTYTPGNEPGWQVEAGNVGQHYYLWRYGQLPQDDGTAPPDGTEAPNATATETAVPTVTETPPDEQAGEYVYQRQWGLPVDPNAAMVAPYGVGESGDGYIYITDGGADRVMKFTANGAFVTMWGESGSGDNQFDNPQGVAVDSSGNVYVADSGNHLIKKFDSNGKFLDAFDGEGNGSPKFLYPNGVTVDASGNIYVTDAGNRRVVKLDTTGAFVDDWDSGTSTGSTFASVSGIDVYNSYVIVLDHASCRVSRLNQFGQDFDEWTTDSACGVERPGGLSVHAPSGYVYVTDSYDKKLLTFDYDGNLKNNYDYPGGVNTLDHFPGLAVDENEQLYVIDGDENLLEKYDAGSGLNLIEDWRDARRGRFADDTLGMAGDADGHLYLSDATYDRIQVFDEAGTYLRNIGEPGQYQGQIEDPVALAASSDGHLYVADDRNDRIIKFTLDGVFVTEWGETGSTDGKFEKPRGLATDGDGNVYVVDAQRNRVQKFDSSGNLLTAWGQPGQGDGQFDTPWDIVVYGDRVYVADTQNNRVQVFDRSGNHKATWNGASSPGGPFDKPRGVGVDAGGNVFIVDSANDRVRDFGPDGSYLTQFGTAGSTAGAFNAPTRVEIGGKGEVYVLDTGNHRVQVFERSP